MKKIAVTLVLLYCFFINTVFAESLLLEYDGGIHNYTGDVYSLVINGKTLEDLPLNPIIFNDRAVVPVREVFEALGATVTYVASDNTVRVYYKNTTVKLTIGAKTAIVNGLAKNIPDGVGAKLIGKWGEFPKTMVPIRFISENIGLDVGYDGENKIISVSEKKSTRPTANPTATPKPTVTPTPTKTPTPTGSSEPIKLTAKLTKLSYDIDDDMITVKITASSSVDSISKAVLTSSGTLYADIFGAQNTLATRTEIDEDCIMKAIRIGQHDEYTRVAIDTENVEKYAVSLSSDNKTITFKLTADEDVDLEIPEPTNTPKPTTTPKPSPGATIDPSESASPSPTPTPMYYDTRKIVVLDAGHGGYDPGASGYLMTEEEKAAYLDALENDEKLIATMEAGNGEKIDEKDIALAVTKKVKENLEDNGIEVILTREGDTYPTLDSRPELANEEGAVIFVSIHLNSTVSPVTGAKGIEVYYSTQNNDDELGITSKELAEEILDCVVESTDAFGRGVKSGNLLVNRKCRMPSALIEIGFMNNPVELELMIDEDYQDKLAAGIARGIISMHEEIEIPEEKEK
ncbi:MAG: N-acetylmuramoyl-L-alanine amidase [Clostridia bacterium]|nr:N-acetylmuramoyl-L-alanine amidase [Clostridia bacterium]